MAPKNMIDDRRRCALMLLWPLLAIPMAGCLEWESTRCSEQLTCPAGWTCAANQAVCIEQGEAVCGDGTVQQGEQCDDGNLKDGDGCSSTCESNESCGNGKVDVVEGELCDDGNRLSGDGCSADCRLIGLCGNGIVDLAEVCDDGNAQSGDGCSRDCKSDERCGNSRVDVAVGELCDDGNRVDNDGCSADCRSGEVCGNGVRDSGEECDTGGQSATCNANCSISRCGDGIVNSATGEQCDDGNTNPTDGCSNNCKRNVCGNGIVEDGEACDDGNTSACGICSANCQVYQYSQATGSITAISGGGINDGETFTLNDGVHAAKVFEFDKNAQVSAGSVRVVVWKRVNNQDVDMSATEVARSIQDAINGTSSIMVEARNAASSAVVMLRNVTANPAAGSFGNQHIFETVSAAGFVVVHMADGGGSDCPAGTHCKYSVDCASGNCSPVSGVLTCQ